MSEKITAGLLIIGDEILSGRTLDKNTNFLAKSLEEIGISLSKVIVIPDIEDEIIDAVNSLREQFKYVFTSGGIGPTHDDITSASIAKAFNVDLIKHKEAEEILINFYGKENVNEARLKMAYVPEGSILLNNPVSSAPGFKIDNVFIMAGVPKIFEAMFAAAKKELLGGKIVHAKEIKINVTESIVAKELGDLQKEYQNVSMGSYPFQGGTSLVFRSVDNEAIEKSSKKMVEIVERIRSNSIIEDEKN